MSKFFLADFFFRMASKFLGESNPNGGAQTDNTAEDVESKYVFF